MFTLLLGQRWLVPLWDKGALKVWRYLFHGGPKGVNLGVPFCLGDPGGNCVGVLIWELGAIFPLLVSLTRVLHGESSSFTPVSLSSGSKNEHVTSGCVGCCSWL